MKTAGAIVTILLHLAVFSAAATEQNSNRLNGIPSYQIYEANDIEDNSNGSFITSSPDGRLFYGNESGLHSFDGTSWKKLIATPLTRDKIRAIAWTKGGVFASGYGTIGRLEFTKEHGIRYQAINDDPLTKYAREVYSTIHQSGELLYFIGERSAVEYNLATQEIRSKSFDSWVKGSIVSRGKLHVATTKDGVVVFENGIAAKLPAYERFTENHVIHLFALSPEGEIVFATESNDIYRIPADRDFSHYTPFEYVPSGAARDIEFVGNDRIALSISGKGIFVVDRKGTTTAALEKSIDYRWSGANKLHFDKNETLWVQFNSTVGKILINNPVTQIDERLRSSVDFPTAHILDDDIFIQANGKVLYPKFNENGGLDGLEEAIPDIDLSIATANASQNGLYIYGESKYYLLSHGEILRIGEIGAVDRIDAFKNDPTRFFATSSEEIKIIRRDGDALSIEQSIPHNVGFVNKIAESDGLVFWLEIGLGQIGRVWFEAGQLKFKLYDHSNGLPPNWIAIWKHQDQVYFTESSGAFRFDEKNERFEPVHFLDDYFPKTGPIQRLATDPKGNIWASYNNSTYILWKQENGSYTIDSESLRQVSGLYVNQFMFLPQGGALLLAASDIYHVDGSLLHPPDPRADSPLSLFEISDLEGSTKYYYNLGTSDTPPSIELAKNQRSLAFRFGETNSATVRPPLFQYQLGGVSKDWSKWSASNEVDFTRLASGKYNLRVRSRHADTTSTKEIQIPFSIQPTFWETPYAYLLYLALISGILYFGYNLFAKGLKKTNENLELMVSERTKEIETKNSELQSKANELSKAINELRNAQDLLISTSRKAGMAEVATNVLHNVGNVLNSINVGILSLSERLKQERVSKLARVSELINAHQDDIADFLTKDPKGKAIPAYLTQLATVLKDDFSHYSVEVECMQENIDHVKKIIVTQQTHAKTVEVFQNVNISSLFDDAIEMIMGDLEYSLFEIVRDIDPSLEIVSDKHSLLQMVTNFVKNAKEAVQEKRESLGLISISAKITDDGSQVRIQVSDNGVGISQANLKNIFTHGFTTKSNGHGFGMHSCANAAKILGGDLQISSEGEGKGATVTLTVPISPKGKTLRKAVNRFEFDPVSSRN